MGPRLVLEYLHLSLIEINTAFVHYAHVHPNHSFQHYVI